jgi:hypothetical protein
MYKLIENPYLHYGDMPSSIYDIAGDISVDALKRDFKHLFTITEEDYVIDFLLSHDSIVLLGVINNWQKSKDRVQPIFKMNFLEKLLINKIPEEISRKKILQGSRILLKRDLRRYSISTVVYKRLTEHGYAIISDQTHFDPAKGLWMKLARDSDENYKVILVDIDYGAIKDENGHTLCYNGSNYPEEQLWTTGSDFTGYNLVLGYY